MIGKFFFAALTLVGAGLLRGEEFHRVFDFENQQTGFAGWKLAGARPEVMELVPEKHSGNFSLRLKDVDTGHSNCSLLFSISGKRAEELSGKILRFSGWVRQFSANRRDGVGIGLKVKDATGKFHTVSMSTGTTGETGWKFLTVKMKLPENTVLIMVQIHCATGWKNTGEACFDDLVLTTRPAESDAEPASAATWKSPADKTVPPAAPPEESAEIAAFRREYSRPVRVEVDAHSRPEIRNGTWYRAGRPLFLGGVWIYPQNHIDWGANSARPGLDHPAYRIGPGKEIFDRMGINVAQISAAHQLPAQAILGLPLPADWKKQESRIAEYYRGFQDFPLILDFAFGPVQALRKNNPGLAAEIDQHNPVWHQFVPFCPEHPEGDRYYRSYFLGGVRSALKYGANIFEYELFNESSYNCQCPANTREFARRMRKKYGTIQNANRVWRTVFDSFDEVAATTGFRQYASLWPDWCRFSEDRYVEILRKYRNLILSEDRRKQVYITEQPSGGPPKRVGINYRKMAEVLDVLTLEGGIRYGFHTDFSAANEMEEIVAASGGHWLNCDFFQAIAKGRKPVMNNEHYCARIECGIRVPSRRSDLVTSFWMELMHGLSGSCVYAWDKRVWEWRTFEQAKKNVLHPSYRSSSMLNPYNWPPSELEAFRMFQQELAPYAEQVLPFPRTSPASVAVLFSFPTLRMADSARINYLEVLRNWYGAILFSQFPVKVVFGDEAEELGPEVSALILPGCRYTDPETLRTVKAFAARGGMVIGSGEAFQYDEYGRPLQDTSFLKRVETPSEAAALLTAAGVKRYGEILPLDDGGAVSQAELQIIDRGDFKLVYLLSMEALRSRLVKVRLHLKFDGRFHLKDAVRRKLLLSADRTGCWSAAELKQGIPVILPPQERVLLVLERNCPESWERESEESCRKNFASLRQREELEVRKVEQRVREMRRAEQKKYRYEDVKKEKCRPLDLSRFANMHFKDEIAGDGRGGWFDQGPNDFAAMPLGHQTLAGVPFFILDPETNHGKGVIVLRGTPRPVFPAEVRGIPVGGRVAKLYFLHTMGWSGQQVMTCRVHYADGSETAIPFREKIEIGSWWGVPVLRDAKIALVSRNTEIERINLQCYRWSNPFPDKEIVSLDLISAGSGAVPAVVAITAEDI